MQGVKLLFALIFLPLMVKGQAFTVYNYSIAEGLPSSETYDVFEDRNGFMWIGTDHGVIQFDGQEMKIFQVEDGLTDPVVFGFQEDSRGRLWFRTYSGKLCFLENGKIKHYAYNDKIAQVADNGLLTFEYFAESDELWFSVRNRLGVIDATGNMTVDTLNEATQKQALVYRTKRNKSLLIPSSSTVGIKWVYINEQKFPITMTEPSYVNRVFAKVFWKGKLYLSAYNDVFEYDGKSVRQVIRARHPVISLSTDKDNNLWVGHMKGGVKRYSNSDFKDPWEPEFLGQKSVTKVHQDKNGGIWFSTLENGVYHAPNISIRGFTLPNGSKTKSVNSSGKHIIVGDKTGVVRFYDRKNFNICHEKSFDYNIMSVFSDSRQNFWISWHSAIVLFDSSFLLKKNFLNANANDFYETPDGSVWALGSQRLYQFNAAGDLLKEQIFYENIYRQTALCDSMLFLGGRLGVHVRNSKFNYLKSISELENFKISEILILNDTTVLFCTIGNGFTLLNTNSWKTVHHDAENNFIANNIYATIRKDSILWIGTEKGLVWASVRSLLSNKPEYKYLNKSSGLRSNTVNFLAATDDAVWAFSEDGFSVIPDTLAEFSKNAPVFYLKVIESNDRAVDFKDKLILGPEQNNVKVSFGFISFNNNNVLLRYKIKTDDELWIKTKDRSVELTSLAAGDYSFRLQYSVDNINWKNALDPIVFIIEPPWYKKWFVYPAGLLIIIGLGYMYFRHLQSIYRQKHHYLKIINEHQQRLIQSEVVTLERERNRIAKELHDGVGTTLTAIKLRVRQLLQYYREPLGSEIEEQFQSTITELKNIIYGLTPPSLERYGLFTALKNYINKISKTLPIDISLKTYGYDVSKYDLNLIIFRIIQELVTNSVKHSFASKISIHVSCFDDLISIIYEDDGVGFKYDPVQNGLGLDSIESRIQSINGTLKFDSGDFGISYTIEIPVPVNKEVI
jgi:signal transduction histidine kinase/ligand-binding sensor domain-containing protein